MSAAGARIVADAPAHAPAIRPAVHADIATLDALIARSARALGHGFYAPHETEAAIADIFGVDSELVDDGTYLVAVGAGGGILGCGGWSRRRTLFGGDRFAGRQAGALDPAVDAARIRAFFVDPDAARQGIGSRLLSACEVAAAAAGFRRVALMATLPGVPFYAARGYAAGTVTRFAAGNGTIAFLPMDKWLGSDAEMT